MEVEAESSSITSLALVRLQTESRLLKTACSPDKDLVVILSKVGGEEKMSLWKLTGSKRWEIDMSLGGTASEEITALGWSPDGQMIVAAHYPPRITIHSIHDGKEERSLPISTPTEAPSTPVHITGIWWFKKERKDDPRAMPDLFSRRNIVPGSALSIIKMLPLLDPLVDDSLPLNTTNLFAFQDSTQSRTSPRASSLPEAIASWPTLPLNLLTASIKPLPRPSGESPGEEYDVEDLTNVDSLLAAIDSAGQIHCFLDGSYPLGTVTLDPTCEAISLMKRNDEKALLVQAEFKPSRVPGNAFHNLNPLSIKLPLLDTKATRHVAESCSAARELMWYTMRVVREMRKSWIGGERQEGAREMNQNYVRGLEERQLRHDQEVDAIYDLTIMLTTEKVSPALADYHQSGEPASERTLQKWESTIGEALLHLRDYSEKQIAPACQRLHLILEEVRGWSLLPQLYGQYDFSTEEIDQCLDMVARAIILAAWLASSARQELFRFSEFMLFLRFETTRLNSPGAFTPLRHDILSVNEYLMSGLVESPIDAFFTGPVPQFSLDSVAIPHTRDLRAVIDRAKEYIADPANLTWPPIIKRPDLSHLDRNLDALIHALAERCSPIFDRAAKAVARTAILDESWSVLNQTLSSAEIERPATKLVRSRATCEESGNITEHIATCISENVDGSTDKRELLCLIRTMNQHEGGSNVSANVAVAILECKTRRENGDAWSGVPEDGDMADFYISDMDFFDEQSLVIVYSVREGPEVIAMVDYGDIAYSQLGENGYVNGRWREDIVAEAIKQARAGQLARRPAPIRKRRALGISRGTRGPDRGGTRVVKVAVNGRVGRRVACVLGAGTELEMLDMEGDEDGEEGEGGEEEEKSSE